MKTTTSKAGSVVAAVVTLSISSFAMAACGGSGSGGGLSAEQQALADAIAKDTASEGIVDETQSQCFGEAIVKDMGTDRLAELGVTVDTPGGLGDSGNVEPTDADANKVVDAFEKCADLKELMTKTLAASLSPETASCVMDNLSDEQLRSLLVLSMQNKEPSGAEADEMRASMEDCGLG